MRYWIRLIFIVLFTLILLWYSNQTNNNPYIKQPYIKISHNNSFFYISCYEKSNRLLNNSLLFILQSYHLGLDDREEYKFPKTSILFTLHNIPGLTESFSHPPSKWIIFDSLKSSKNSNKTIPFEWPEPIYSMNFSAERTTSIQTVFPFADTTRAIQFSYNSIDMLILCNIPDSINMDVRSIFRERYSIIVNTHPHIDEKIQQIRKLFRPVFLIILPLNSENMLKNEINNSILAVNKKGTFIFHKDSKGEVRLK